MGALESTGKLREYRPEVPRVISAWLVLFFFFGAIHSRGHRLVPATPDEGTGTQPACPPRDRSVHRHHLPENQDDRDEERPSGSSGVLRKQ